MEVGFLKAYYADAAIDLATLWERISVLTFKYLVPNYKVTLSCYITNANAKYSQNDVFLPCGKLCVHSFNSDKKSLNFFVVPECSFTITSPKRCSFIALSGQNLIVSASNKNSSAAVVAFSLHVLVLISSFLQVRKLNS